MNLKLRIATARTLAAMALLGAPAAFGASLLDVYQRALQSDPLIREAEATRLASREARPQAWAALLPQVNGSGSLTKSNTEGSQVIPGTTNVIDSTTDSTSKRYGASLNQTIFRWDQWASVQRADKQVALAEATYLAATQDLAVRVAQRYFSVLASQDALDASAAAAEASARQLEQAEKRFEVGLIAITDVQDARAERDRTAADVISAKRALATNQELLREITDEPVDALAAPGDDMPLNPPEPASPEDWIGVAMENNLSLVAARLNADIASKNVAVARSGHLPTLDLSGSYNKSDSDTETTIGTLPPTSRTTSQDSKSIALLLNVPIFSGGATQSRVRQQVYTFRAARERVERTSRETERSARDNYMGVVSNIARVQALKQAYESSRTAMQATQAGYEVGTRTSVDVLISQRALYSAQTAYLKSRYDYINSVIALKQAAGLLTKDDVVEINSWLK